MHTAYCKTTTTLARPASAASSISPSRMIAVCLAWLVLGAVGSPAGAAEPKHRPPPLIVDEKPPLFVPAKPRAEAEVDRVEALALFSAARIRENRQDYAEALRMYQRAFRCDPQSASIVRAIVPLAVRLNRHSEAVRYALKLVEMDEPDPQLLKRLAGYLTEIGDFGKALALFEKALAAGTSAKPSSDDVVLWMELGRLCFLTEQYAKAAGHFQRVLEALDRPEQFGLDKAVKKTLLGQPGPVYAMMGESFLLAGQPQKAAATFEKGQKEAPNKGLLGYQLAKVDFKTGKPEAALQKLQAYFDARLSTEEALPYQLLADVLKSLKKENELIGRLEKLRAADLEALKKSGELSGRLEKLSAADLESLKKLLAADLESLKKSAELIGDLGKRIAADLEALKKLHTADLESLKKSGELIGHLRKLRAADGENAWLGYYLAEKYFEAGRFDQAEKLYRQLVAKRPAVVGYRNLVQIYRKGKRYDELLKLLGEAVEKLGSLDAVAPKGQTLAEDTELVRGVVEAARKQLKNDPKALPHQARLAIAMLTADAKQWDTAGEFFDLAIQSQPDQAAKLLLTWGLGLLLKEENARAVKVFERAIEQKALPADDPTFHFYLAGALELAGRTEPALAAARKSAELAKKRASGPKSSGKGKEAKEAKDELPRYLTRAAWVLYHAKRYDEAIQGYREVVQKYAKDYSSGEIRKAVREARLVLSNLAVLKSDLPKAEEWLEEILDEFPDDPSALNDLGYLWADQGKHLDRAHRMIRLAVQQEPDNAAYRDSLGWVLFRKGQVREALPELEKAAALEPDPTVLEHLGDAYRAAGQNEKAKKSWRKAIEAYRKAHEEQKAKKVEEKLNSSRG